jgi:hypothetical protein
MKASAFVTHRKLGGKKLILDFSFWILDCGSWIKDAAAGAAGGICDRTVSEAPVIPAKAGIQCIDRALHDPGTVDSRFRGNDCGVQRPGLANDTDTRPTGRCLFNPIP